MGPTRDGPAVAGARRTRPRTPHFGLGTSLLPCTTCRRTEPSPHPNSYRAMTSLSMSNDLSLSNSLQKYVKVRTSHGSTWALCAIGCALGRPDCFAEKPLLFVATRGIDAVTGGRLV